MAAILDIADAVVTSLNAADFSKDFTATRSYLQKFDLEDMDTLRVTVVGKGMEVAAADRNERVYDYTVDVAVQQRFDEADANSDLDLLMDLVEEIEGHLTGVNLTAGSDTARWIGTENGPIYAQKHMSERRQFTSVLSFTYRMWR